VVVQELCDVSLPLSHGSGLFDNPWCICHPPSNFCASSNNTLPATSVDVEHLFSHGRLVLSHVCNRLSVQSTCTLLCLGSWSLLGLVEDTDVLVVTTLDDIEENDKCELEEGWDHIV